MRTQRMTALSLKVVMPKNIDVGALVTPKKEKDPDSTESPSMVQPLSILKIKSGFPLFRNHKIPGFFQDFSRNLMPFSRYIFALAANLQLQF